MLVGKEIGPFVVERELGSGAMGTVYRATNRETGQRVALKVIADVLLGNETAVKRFEREADILKQLKHPNIVRLIGTGRYKKKTPFFIMEYVEGESLDRVLARRGTLDKNGRFGWDEVVSVGQQLCDALHHAHQKGIIHRDLKPSNVMVLADGTVKLTDFGIAKDTDVTALTGANSTVGTAAYMSPEQCKGEKTLSHKSDLYSMGVMFYELLTGRKPFMKDNPVDMFLAHVNETPERPSRIVLDIPVWLDTLVIQLMEKKPEHRPYDAAMVRRVLDEVEHKVSDQRSAGVDAATARGGMTRTGADATDREAARTLRAAAAKKKVKKRSTPLFERGWVKAIGLIGALGAIAGFAFVMTRPPSAENLYVQAKAATEASGDDRLDKVIETSTRYLNRYGSRGDDIARQVQGWWEGAWAEKRERQLHNRFNSKFLNKPDGDAEKLAFDGLTAENEGDVAEARQRWEALESKYRDDADPDLRAFSLVARKKLRDLDDLARREARLMESIQLLRIGRTPERAAEDPAERKVEEALRYETFGDLPAALKRYTDVREHNLKDLAPRPWVVFSARRARELKPQVVEGGEKVREFRKDLLQRKLAEVRDVPPTADPSSRRRAEVVARDVADLYRDDPVPEFATIARQAAQLVKALTRS